ncbi:MAG: isoprenylcysteine carboxylmethyltransferase family protein [Bacteroidales bacterium]|jgi:protein-S-isoprenylcysteine O-methyltransferase Ste14
MKYIYEYLFLVTWISYFIYWWLMAKDVKSSIRTESTLSRVIRSLSIILALLLLWISKFPIPILNIRFLSHSYLSFGIGFIFTAGGLLFSVWARKLLGKNWSQAVTIKDNHQLIKDGPYALVRHPIYTGLILGFIGTSIAVGEVRGLISDILVFAVLLYKLRLEDKWLIEQFGESYKIYSQKVSALIPFIL